MRRSTKVALQSLTIPACLRVSPNFHRASLSESLTANVSSKIPSNLLKTKLGRILLSPKKCTPVSLGIRAQNFPLAQDFDQKYPEIYDGKDKNG